MSSSNKHERGMASQCIHVECFCEQRHLCQLERQRARREFRRVTVLKHANEIIQIGSQQFRYRLAALMV